ncbi:carbamate kinase [Nocardioides mesophilus]|uniref:Carbamate kinase n=1 Tax=Nocardioides mesophilus TaxID=433659 RepID=A0A7G9RB28_9ACTN|nr:carbamate kinase [Nocardioides mesophilus]QNN52803.1 carbamate kinase [Nocardioides mesophilus]
MRIVIALGGNALLQRGQRPDCDVQEANVARAVAALAPLAAHHEIVITHGNGPQVGVLALQSASDPHLTTPYPFDVLGAQTQGMIGYWLLQAMQNALPGRQVAAIINQTLVEANDPAFQSPSKFVGEVYDEAEAHRLAELRGWTVRPDGDVWRRVVGSPKPRRVVETRLIRLLLTSGAVVICAGGGGVPVIRNEQGHLEGVEAVVDKDLTTSVLAEALEADAMLVLTDVANVARHYGSPQATPILRATPAALRRESFPAGSMGPKVEAVCRFVEVTGDMAAIGRLEDAVAIIEGTAGTVVTPAGDYGGPDDLRPGRPAPSGPA